MPKTFIIRKGYYRRNGVYVKPARIRNRGLPGKGPYILPKPRKGGLRKYGYFTNLPATYRHAALMKAIRANGYVTIMRRLVLISNYNKRSTPKIHRIMRSDINWMKNAYS